MKLKRYITISFIYLSVLFILFFIEPWIAELVNMTLTLPWAIFEENIITAIGLNLSTTVDNIPYRRLIHLAYSMICFLINIVLISKLLCFFKSLRSKV
ncbi:hypothetical protein HMPREF2572_05215 [Neisseria sp. HMSC064E01]|nr:hypothetical protein HMPREF2572_05215 [Neisseria sp. HMSC064E01]